MASNTMSALSYLDYLNSYISISLNDGDRCLIAHLNKSYFDEIEIHARTILAEWYSEQIIDAQSSLYIRNVGYLNRKLGLLTSKYHLNKNELERIENLLLNSEMIQLITSTIESIIETDARHQDNFLSDLLILIDAYTVINNSKTVFDQITKQVMQSKYYKQYLTEILSSTIKPIHVFFVGIIGQCAIPIHNPTFNKIYAEFFVKFYNGKHLTDNIAIQSCTLGILAQLDYAYLINDHSCISILRSIFINASSKVAKENHKNNFLLPILKIFNSLCIKSKTIACYLNSDQLVDTLLQYVTNQTDLRLNTNACVLLGHIVSDKQLDHLRISYKLTMKFVSLLDDYKEETNDILQSYLSLAIHTQIQSVIVDTYQLTDLIELSDDHPIIYDIIWKLSFHSNIVEQLIMRHDNFLKKLSLLPEMPAACGILQNVQLKNVPRLPIKDRLFSDIAVVSSRNDCLVIQKVHEYLEKSSFRIGTVQSSSEILLCISEETKHDCSCQAAIRQAVLDCKKIFLCTVKTPYRFDDWFRSLNIDEKKLFNTNESSIEKMMSEIQIDLNHNHNLPAIVKHTRIVSPLHQNIRINLTSNSSTPTLSLTTSLRQPPSVLSPRPPLKNIQSWTKGEVLEWCAKNNLNSFTKILTLYDGRSLLALAHVSRMSAPHMIINQLRNDCRRHGLNLSFVEFVRFQAALDDLLRVERLLTRRPAISTLAARYVLKRKPKNKT
ncbi:unnamed protein product [Rotaria magnacalcarata]